MEMQTATLGSHHVKLSRTRLAHVYGVDLLLQTVYSIKVYVFVSTV